MEFIIFFLLFVVFSVWYHMRNNQVYNFKSSVNKLCYWRNKRHNCVNSWSLFYDKLPTYNRMFWSFKPLVLSSFLSEEEICSLLN